MNPSAGSYNMTKVHSVRVNPIGAAFAHTSGGIITLRSVSIRIVLLMMPFANLVICGSNLNYEGVRTAR